MLFHYRVLNVTFHISGMRKESTGVFHFKTHVRLPTENTGGRSGGGRGEAGESSAHGYLRTRKGNSIFNLIPFHQLMMYKAITVILFLRLLDRNLQRRGGNSISANLLLRRGNYVIWRKGWTAHF